MISSSFISSCKYISSSFQGRQSATKDQQSSLLVWSCFYTLLERKRVLSYRFPERARSPPNWRSFYFLAIVVKAFEEKQLLPWPSIFDNWGELHSPKFSCAIHRGHSHQEAVAIVIRQRARKGTFLPRDLSGIQITALQTTLWPHLSYSPTGHRIHSSGIIRNLTCLPAAFISPNHQLSTNCMLQYGTGRQISCQPRWQ